MKQEIITLHGKSFKIWYEYPKDRIDALKEAESMCEMCNLSKKDNIITLAPTCSATSKTVGQTINLTSNPAGGTGPYTYSFYKMLPGSTTPVWLGTQKQASNTLTYTTLTEDITNASGQQLKIGAVIYDSCICGSQTNEESCYVNVLAPCALPAVNLTVT